MVVATRLAARRLLQTYPSTSTSTSTSIARCYATEAGAGPTKTLVFLEHRDGKLNPGSLNALSAASALGGEVVGLVTGDPESADKVAAAAKK